MAPSHPLAGSSEITLRMLGDHATVSQSVLLPICQYLDSRYSWLFTENAPVLATNSLQLLKQSLLRGSLAMITSALDMLPEIEAGDLVFIPLRERGLKPQTIAVAIDARRSLPRAARVVAEHLAEHIEARLQAL